MSRYTNAHVKEETQQASPESKRILVSKVTMEQFHRHTLKTNHTKLARLTSSNLTEVLSYLQSYDIINNNMRERVSLPIKTPTEQAGDLLFLLPTRGPHAFQAFYDALKVAELYDAADLIMPDSAPHGPSYNPQVSSNRVSSSRLPQVDDESGDEDLPDHWPLSSEEYGEVKVKRFDSSTAKVQLQKLYDKACSPEGQRSYYQMLHKCRGICLIIDNKEFKHLQNREGTNKDVSALNFLFQGLGFDVFKKSDLDSEEMKDLLQKKIAKKDHSNYDCCVVVLLTHGENGVVFGINGKTDEDGRHHDSLSVEWIRDLLCSVPSLLNKPKLVFIQACRGKTKDPGFTRGTASSFGNTGKSHEDMESQLSSPPGSPDLPTPTSDTSCTNQSESNQESAGTESNQDVNLRNIKVTVADFGHRNSDEVDAKGDNVASRQDAFLAMSTTAGQVSWRNTESGTWFIQAIVWVFSRFAYKYDINVLMTKVTDLVRLGEVEGKGYKQVNEIIQTMPKQFYFFPSQYKLE